MDRGTTTARIWESFEAAIRRYVSSRISVAEDVEDVLQEIFLRIHKSASEIRSAERVQSWVFQVARGVIADHYRRHYRKPPHSSLDLEGESPAEEMPELNLAEYDGDHEVHEEVLSWLEPMIEELPDKYAKALHLSDIEGRSQTEIAKELGISYSGAKSRVQRARQMLGKVLTDCCAVEFGTEGKVIEYRRLKRGC